MKWYGRWAAYFGATLCLINFQVLCFSPPTFAQTARTTPLNYGGWQAVPESAQRATIRGDVTGQNSGQVKQAFFQAPGVPSLPGIDSLPGNNSTNNSLSDADQSVLPSYGAAALPLGSPVQPAGGPDAFNQFSNPGGYLPPTDVRQASGAGLRDAQVGAQAVLPPVMPPPSSSAMPPAGYRNAVYQQTNGQPGYAPQGYPQPGYGDPNNLPPAQLRDSSVAHQNANQGQVPGQAPQYQATGQYQAPQVATVENSRLVSPPPRVGNFATSPYRPPFRLASQPLPAQTVQVPNGLANQPANVPVTPGLAPQYQPTVGIYPVGYAPGQAAPSYQASYQAGQYCAPSIPAGGVPQVVPGAFAPPTLPPNLTPQLYSPDNSGFKPLFSLGQENYNVQLGRGIIGQPTVYVAGQPVRNFLRYLAP